MHTQPKKHLPAILAVSFAYLLTASILYPIQSVNAQLPPTKIQNLGQNILEVHYQESTGILWALGGSRSVEGLAYLLEINPITNTLVQSYNMSSYLDGGAPMDVWCGSTSCFITSRNVGNPDATVGSIVRIETVVSKGTVSGVFNSTNTERGFGRIDGRDSTGTGIGGIALFVESYNSSDSIKVIIVGGVGTMSKSADFSIGNVSAAGTKTMYDLQWSGIAGSTENYLFAFFEGATNTSLIGYILNAATLANVCNTVTTITGGSGGGQLILDMEHDIFYIPDGSDGNYDSSDFACTETLNVITDANTGLSGVLTQKNGVIVSDKSAVIFQESGANARIGTTSYNSVTGTISTFDGTVIEISPNNSQSAVYGRSYLAVEHDNDGQIDGLATIGTGSTAYNGIFIPMDADQAIFVYKFGASSSGGGGEQPAPVFPQNNVAELVGLTFCLGGFIPSADCNAETGLPSDTDPTTNGTGVALLIFLIIISYAFIVAIHYQAQRTLSKQNVQLVEVMNIHPIILVVMVFADFALTWYFGYISDIVFYTFIVIVIGLAGFGIYRQVKPSS